MNMIDMCYTLKYICHSPSSKLFIIKNENFYVIFQDYETDKCDVIICEGKQQTCARKMTNSQVATFLNYIQLIYMLHTILMITISRRQIIKTVQ